MEFLLGTSTRNFFHRINFPVPQTFRKKRTTSPICLLPLVLVRPSLIIPFATVRRRAEFFSSSSSFGNNNVKTAQNYIPFSEDSSAKSFLLDLLNLGQLQPAISPAKE